MAEHTIAVHVTVRAKPAPNGLAELFQNEFSQSQNLRDLGIFRSKLSKHTKL